ncbi:hypothetical protein MAFF301524_09450 [Ralstonia pseudosolanacearum]|nr:hypothetical protein MAFF301524_09450 [Ralstonia pseudosolanacearum]
MPPGGVSVAAATVSIGENRTCVSRARSCRLHCHAPATAANANTNAITRRMMGSPFDAIPFVHAALFGRRLCLCHAGAHSAGTARPAVMRRTASPDCRSALRASGKKG